MTKLSITLIAVFALSACQSTNVAKVEQDDKVEQNEKVKKKVCSSAPSTGSRVKKRAC